MRGTAFELEQVRLADRHIEAAQRRIAALEAMLAEQRRLGHDVEPGEQVLEALRRGLAVFQRHRELMFRNLEDARRRDHANGGGFPPPTPGT